MYLDISHCYLLYRSSSRALSPSPFLSPFAHRSRGSRSALTFRLPFFFFLIRSSYSSSLATSLSLRSLPLESPVIETRNRYKNITLSVSDSEPRARIPRDDRTMLGVSSTSGDDTYVRRIVRTVALVFVRTSSRSRFFRHGRPSYAIFQRSFPRER